MAVKKATSRTRTTTTTKRSKAPTSTTKRATKAAKTPKVAKTTKAAKAATVRTAAPAAPAVYTPEPAQLTELAPPQKAPSGGSDRPSQFTGDYYLHATGPEPAEGTVRRPGKWLIFVSRNRVDALWDAVRRALKAGRLGHAAKVSTALPHPESRDRKKHVVCVYTANEDDAAEVRRVRAALRELGVSWKIPYKSDPSGGASQYEDAAGGPAAKYYE
jgi:Domain of unknown function (DUF1917)